MKILKYLFFIGLTAQFINAQSIVIGTGASIDVGLGADICATTYGNITGTLTGDGTQCGSPLPKVLNLTALIQGFYNGVTMGPDTVTVQLRNTGSPYALVEQKKVVLSSSGAGTGSLISVLNGTSYYLVVKHRNSIETWSATGKSFTSNLLNYDFTTASAQAYSDGVSTNLPMKQIGSKWCFWSGDVTQNYFIEFDDLIQVYNKYFLGLEVPGYYVEDVTGNGYVEYDDLLLVYNNYKAEVYSQNPLNPVLTAKHIKGRQILNNSSKQ
jgi:hypothetical protein